MLTEEKLNQLRSATEDLKLLISNKAAPEPALLSRFISNVESVVLDAHLTLEECNGFQASYEQVKQGIDSLAALKYFTAQETIPGQWTIEDKDAVVASGQTLLAASVSLGVNMKPNEGLATAGIEEL